LVFLTILTLCLSLVYVIVINHNQLERLQMEQLILERGIRIDDTLSRMLNKTYIISATISYNYGNIPNFPQLASMLISDPAVLHVTIAPNGIVSEVYPLRGNEALIGHNFLAEESADPLTKLALQDEQLVLGGPFEASPGEYVLRGKMPVYLYDPAGHLWGFVSVTIEYPMAFLGTGLGELRAMGYDYEIWSVDTQTNERSIISTGGYSRSPGARYVEMPISVANAQWHFRIISARAWYNFPEKWLSIAVSIILSLLVTAAARSHQNLKKLKDKFEQLSNIDPLTGAHNRRYFVEHADLQVRRLERNGRESYMFMLDLDNFKKINDAYGHKFGDVVLKEFAERTMAVLRPYDLFARWGGEEFVILISEIEKSSALSLAERVRSDMASRHISDGTTEVTATVSIGIARITSGCKLEDAVSRADAAMYHAKEQGRNRYVLYDEG